MPMGFLWTFWAQLGLLSLIIVFKTKTFAKTNANTEEITTVYNLHLSPVLVENLIEGPLDAKAGSFHLNLTIFILVGI